MIKMTVGDTSILCEECEYTFYVKLEDCEIISEMQSVRGKRIMLQVQCPNCGQPIHIIDG